jgi:hypothetical protein
MQALMIRKTDFNAEKRNPATPDFFMLIYIT